MTWNKQEAHGARKNIRDLNFEDMNFIEIIVFVIRGIVFKVRRYV